MLLRHPILSTLGISAAIVLVAVVLSVASYQIVGRNDPGFVYEAWSAFGIAGLLAPTFLYPWIRTAAKLRRATADLARLANTDRLTGLPNLAVLDEEIRRNASNLSGSGTFAVHFIDLDHFKQVNDTLGHKMGDALLVEVADRLVKTVRDDDTVARFGGDEFVLLQGPLRSAAQASDLANRIVEALSGDYHVEGQQVVLGATVGIALMPHDGTEPAQLISKADMAMYEAKLYARGTWRFFEEAMAEAVRARRNLELDVRSAFAKDAFEVHFQPILDLKTLRVTSCEALVRWRDHTRGLILPGEFITAAENIGLIVDIGKWVLREACIACHTWPNDTRVAVNLSPIQFRRCNMVEVVKEVLAVSLLAADRLELEITEALLLQDIPQTRSVLEELRRMGVRISLDDFGTGQSGLNYLHSFPLDKVKIDRSFVQALGESERSRVLLRGIAKLSSELGLTVAVEGIETDEQLAIVAAETGINEVQGFLFSAALPERRIRELLWAASVRDLGRPNARPGQVPRPSFG
jgi:diguanylate cyclase (GGDEF)-like protein